MEPDLALVLGVIIAGFSIPSILSAMSDRRAPRASALTILIGGGLILFAVQSQPGGYSLGDVPEVFNRVFNRYLI
ncbi:hypothetical protein JQT66_08110 [Sulfitobacter mediterraneus]|jgi:hypothetical protein|uniref:50S ribosomal protein L35 n=2 Tax=Sulfitobacter mediterraneus TaxID=83219 RepID=A0A061SRX3_9RHOB|nr:hypothetical protein [Sulfitobacter mediterraneus]KAJ04461.1 50S ribosomal protein L35 [Sulfitobacter mediterraneus]KIN78498.1 50S ribosomal protein L35 [Sulfitobacter mediterraneus KCTC 32188]MBM1310126.1 hypothetical protein [Sulfitobacter mediterraneus]MBM1314010.1 hypothetical protein [Sulfitobacter mediterraneus]MBM1322370.1 hypothetical protein [Sulfitobacter mediterraneus]